MVLGVGLISAVILSKNISNRKTRLQKLAIRLKQHPLKSLQLVEVPVKNMVSILLIICICFFFNYFKEEFLMENKKEVQRQIHIAQLEKAEKGSQLIWDITNQQKQGKGLKIDDQASKLSQILSYLNVFYGLIITGLIVNSRVKVIEVKGKSIEIKQYNKNGFPKLDTIQLENNVWRMIIRQAGTQKFIFNTSHYVIQIINLKEKRRKYELIRRADPFHIRKSLVQISNVLGFEPDLKIH